MRPLTRREYVLDVAAETERRDAGYTFWCRRVLWSQPLKFDNELYVTVHYNQVGPPRRGLRGHLWGDPPVSEPSPESLCSVPPQVLPDYLKGLFTILPPARPGERHFPHVAKLAALQHRAKDRHHLPTAYGPGAMEGTRALDPLPSAGPDPHPRAPRRREVQDYVPPQLFRLLKAQSWLQMVTQQMQQAQALSAHQARAQFLGEEATGWGGDATRDAVLTRTRC